MNYHHSDVPEFEWPLRIAQISMAYHTSSRFTKKALLNLGPFSIQDKCSSLLEVSATEAHYDACTHTRLTTHSFSLRGIPRRQKRHQT